MQDDYDGDFTSRRVLLYTLRFTAKTYLFGPVTSASKDIIKKATVNYLSGRDPSFATRDVTYSVTPRAIKDYTGDVATNISNDINKGIGSWTKSDLVLFLQIGIKPNGDFAEPDMSLIIEDGTQYLNDNDLNEIAKYLLNISKK